MRRHPGLLTVAVVLLLGGAVAAVDLNVPPVEPPPPPVPADDVPPEAGTWTCAVGDRRDASELQVTAARPGALGDPPSTTVLETFEGGEARSRELPALFPGTHASTTVGGGDALGVFARWDGGPVALWREWRLAGEELPPGTVAGGCPRAVADHWVVPGLITTGGSDARLRLANPFRADATVAVGFVTPEGPEAPIALQNLTVSARSTREIAVNEVLPERDDLAAVVEVLAGRLAVEGYQLTRSAIGDVDGASLLEAGTEPAEVWTVPWISDGEDRASWLWVTNLGDRPAPVELTFNTEDGGVVPDGLAEVTVPPGTVRRVDLRGTFPEDVRTAAVTARSDGAPVYVSAATRIEADAVEDTAFAVQLGGPAGDAGWTVVGGATADRREFLHLVNPGSEAAEVDVVLFNGTTALRPDALAGVEVPPGGLRSVSLHDVLGDVDQWSAFVTAASGQVVVGRIGTGGEEARHLVAVRGVPASAWRPVGGGLVAVPEAGLVQRLGTSLGIRAADPFAPPGPADDRDERPGLDDVGDPGDAGAADALGDARGPAG